MTKGIIITNRLYWEIKNYYPGGISSAEEALMIFNEKSDVELPIEEAANTPFMPLIHCLKKVREPIV